MKYCAMLTLTLTVLLSNIAIAQQQTNAQRTSDIISYGTVFTNIGLDVVHSFRSTDRKCALISESIKIGSTILITETLKHFIHETRPDGSDDKSFPSEHTALAMTTSGWNVYWGTSLGIGTGIGRVAANRHHWYDVLAGGSIGFTTKAITDHVAKCEE